MRRTGIFIVVLLILSLIFIPVLAQGGTIARIVDGDEQFSILQQFLEAAPEIREKLDSTGTYTLFAPDDRAFRNLESALDLPLSTLISDVEIVTAILDYHIVAANWSVSRIRSTQPFLRTELQSAFIGTSLNDRGEIALNDVVEIVPPAISASNGTIHVVNDVLLNRVIFDLLDDIFGDEQDATQTPTPTPAPVSTPPPITTANVRIANFAVDVPAISALITDDTIIEMIESGTVTEFNPVARGIYTVRLIDSDNERDVDLDVDLTLLNGDFVTIVLSGSLEEDSLTVDAITGDFDGLDDDESRIILYHAVEDASAISMLPSDIFDIEGLRFADFAGVDIDAGDYAFSLVETRSADTVLADVEEQSFAGNALYFVAVYSTDGEPGLLILETTSDDAQALQSPQTVTPVLDDSDMTEAPTGDETVFAILQADEDFSILLHALEAIAEAQDEGDTEQTLLDILNSDSLENGVTLLAPDNQAFTNLLSSIGYSENRLLSNTRLMTSILEYHMIGETITQEQFVELSGTSIQTFLELSGRFFVRASDEGRIFLNGTIEFRGTEIQGSNGIIHVVDDVLLPQIALEAFGF